MSHRFFTRRSRRVGHLGNDCQRRQPGAIGAVLRSVVSAHIRYPEGLGFPARRAAATKYVVLVTLLPPRIHRLAYGFPGSARYRMILGAAATRRTARARRRTDGHCATMIPEALS